MYWFTDTLALVLSRDAQCPARRMPTIIGHRHGIAVCSALRFRAENGTSLATTVATVRTQLYLIPGI